VRDRKTPIKLLLAISLTGDGWWKNLTMDVVKKSFGLGLKLDKSEDHMINLDHLLLEKKLSNHVLTEDYYGEKEKLLAII